MKTDRRSALLLMRQGALAVKGHSMDYSNFKFNGMKLNQVLRAVRREKHFSQQRVADILKVNRSTYSYYETGKSELDLKTALALCEIFDITLDELLNRDPVLTAARLVTDVKAALEAFETSLEGKLTAVSQYDLNLQRLTSQMDDSQRSAVMIYATEILNKTNDL